MNYVLTALIIVLIGVLIWYFYPEQPKAEAKIMYSQPIGPTQSPPYRLPSEVLVHGGN